MQMIDMQRTQEDMAKSMMPPRSANSAPDYPYGLCICLTHEEMAKLGLGTDVERGDTLHLFALAQVKSVNVTQSEGGDSCRVELQITHLSLEDEDMENAQEARATRRYGGEEEAEEAE